MKPPDARSEIDPCLKKSFFPGELNQNVPSTAGHVSKKLDTPYKLGPSKAWLKIKNPNAPAATRAIDGT
jgi:hypothetical protein